MPLKRPRRDGEISPIEAAIRLEVRPDTIRRWAKETLSGGTATRLQAGSVRRDATGFYWIAETEIERLVSSDEDFF